MIDPTQHVTLGRTGLEVTRLALGGASIGASFADDDDATTIGTVRHAWDLGIRTFDTAPLYGHGASERRMGAALSDRPRDEYVLSTKVGRLVVEPGKVVFDYSADGVRRSLDASLQRLGIERIDIALIHDPDDHWEAAIGEAWPTLERLRAEGVVGAVGAGMNQSAMLARFARETDMEVFLLAGRYTLLEQGALDELLPLCSERGIRVLIGGAMNSGVLADPRPGAHFNYQPAPAAIVERAQRIAATCDRHGVSLRAAAMQFPLAHPAVISLVAGVRSRDHLDEYPKMLGGAIPAQLWTDLQAEGLLDERAPLPGW